MKLDRFPSILMAAALMVATASSAQSAKDMESATLYLQSEVMQVMFAECKNVYPELSEAMDILEIKWAATNKKAVKKGRKVLRKIAKTDGMDLEAVTASEIAGMKQEFEILTTEGRREMCGHLIATYIAES